MKRTISNSKKCRPLPVLALSLMLLFTGLLHAQQAALFQYRDQSVLTSQQQHYSNAWTRYEWVRKHYIVSVNTKLFNQPSITLNIKNLPELKSRLSEIEEHSNGSFSWFGDLSGQAGNANFVINRGMVTGRISSTQFIYLLYPLGDGMHVLLECDPSDMPADESPEGYQQMIQQGIETEKRNQESQIRIDPETGEPVNLAAGSCRVRILVAYTDDADVNLADPVSFCQSCIDATNTAYANSSVYFRCEMAVAILETYAESLNSATDKVRFHDTSDGYMDDVHDYRTYFDADMCILITENLQAGICGEAYTVANSTYTDPFCVVTRGCAVGNLSFPHELAHLYGCRHDPYVDNNSSPYSYGHGYVYFAGLWRTIMAYNDYCDDNGSSCTRIQYFSNPAVSYNSHATGVANANDNESALEASVSNISSLEATTTNKSFAIAFTFSNGEYADVIATNSITNTANYTHNNGSSGSWRTGVYADMKPGFWAKSGSEFVAFTDDCTALRPQAETDGSGAAGISSLENKLLVDPNPFTDKFDLTMLVSEKGRVQIHLLNMLGEKVRDLFEKQVDLKGPYRFTFDGSDLEPGMYLLVVHSASGTSTARIVRSK